MLTYYQGAFSRSWSGAWDWLLGQGILLTWLMTVGPLLVAIIITIYRVFQEHHSWSEAKKDVLKAIVSSVIAFAVVFCVFFIMDAPTQVASYKATADKTALEYSALKAQLDARNSKGLFVECHMAVAVNLMPSPNGRWNSLQIFSQEQTTSLGEMFSPPGSPMSWPKDAQTGFLWVGQCAVTNYSDEVLSRLVLLPHLAFINTIQTDAGAQGRGVRKSTDGHVLIPKLDPGPSNSFLFYISSLAPDFVTVTMPTTATAQPLGSQDAITIPVKSDGNELNFVPFHPTK